MARTVLVDLTPLDTPSRMRGIGRYVHNLALGLAALQPDERQGLHFVGLTELDWLGRYRVTENLASFAGSPDLSHPSKRDHYRWAYQRRLALWRAVRQLGPSLVHLGDPNATPVGMGLAHCPRLVTCHDLIPLHFPERYFGLADGLALGGRRIIARRYRSADHVVAVSEATRRDLLALLELSPEKVTTVHAGIRLERFTPEPHGEDRARRARYGLTDRPYLLYVGDLDWRKNVEGMLGGLQWARAHGAEVELVLAGKLDDAKLTRLDSLAEQVGVSGVARSLGFVSDADLAALYRGAVALLFVSRYEGFGLPLVEAMASGCPVITTESGSLGEIGGDGAWRVPAEDHASIGKAIQALLADLDLHARWAQRGLERARCFTLRTQARAMASLYARVAKAQDSA